jgi:hypothetical protein
MCRHDRRWQVQSVEHGWSSGFQYMCRSCLLATEKWPTPFHAHQQWKKLVKLDTLLEEVLADSPGTA